MQKAVRRQLAQSHDDLAWKLAGCLLEDFKPFLSSVFYDTASKACLGRNVEDWRGLTCGNVDDHQPYELKVAYQVTDLFKQFSFSQDVYTPKQLQDMSTEKFMDNQKRLVNFRYEPDAITNSILFSARGYVDQILGEFSDLEICERATFGKKSSVGIPKRLACEGARFEAPITGSHAHIQWFDRYYSVWNRPAFNYAVSRAASSDGPPYREISVLEAVLVNKTWKSLRMIMPNTTLGTLYSSGLGNTIEDRLRHAQYDIRHLQGVHGELARIGSITGSLVTADQSMASDNITTWLIDTLCSRRWAKALNFGRIEEITLNGVSLKTPTFSTMGIGFTFPLQTLVFLCLLLAIRDECGLDESAVVSVFGDDLIYDERMHALVVDTFPKLGLVMNIDKTFATGNFRESCGFDYYHGINVRPFHLKEGVGIFGVNRKSEAYLYKAINGLLRRWSPYEVLSTSAMLLGEIRAIRGDEVLVVPPDYPDTSGVRADPELAFLLGIERKIKKNRNGSFNFPYLAFEAKMRIEKRHDPYLFQALRSPSQVDPVCSFLKRRGVGDVLEDNPTRFTWEKDPEGGTIRSKLSGKRLPRLVAYIPEQDAGRYRERLGVRATWTSGE